MVPANGFEEIYDLMALLTDAGGPVQHRVRYLPEIEERETINRMVNNLRLGWRVEVRLTFMISTMADEAYVSTIASRMMRSDWTVYFSLDGGTTERVMDIDSGPSPEPIGGKTVAGAMIRMDIKSRELIFEKPAIGSGAW
jgi:hypothetical protein